MDKVRCPYCGWTEMTRYLIFGAPIHLCQYCGAEVREAEQEPRPPDNYIGEQAVEYGAPFDEPMGEERG